MKASKLLLGVLGAAAAGVVVGLLIAPDKGTETRRKISEKTDDWRSHIDDLIQTGKEYLKDIAATLSSEAEGLEEDVKTHYENVKSELS